MCTTGKPSASPKEASATGRPASDQAAAHDDPANLLTQDTFRSSRHHRTTAPPTSETGPSVAPARGWWHRRAGDRSCSGGAQLGTPGTCWCSVAPKDLSDRGALAKDFATDRLEPHRGHTRATNDQIRADNTGHQWFGILPAHRSDLAIRPRSPARSGRCPIGSVAPTREVPSAAHEPAS